MPKETGYNCSFPVSDMTARKLNDGDEVMVMVKGKISEVTAPSAYYYDEMDEAEGAYMVRVRHMKDDVSVESMAETMTMKMMMEK